MTEEWEEGSENGITLGPEEGLRREIEKSKSLKVERLKLQCEIKRLKDENRRLLKENMDLRKTSNSWY